MEWKCGIESNWNSKEVDKQKKKKKKKKERKAKKEDLLWYGLRGERRELEQKAWHDQKLSRYGSYRSIILYISFKFVKT